jgi:hypothetical protein
LILSGDGSALERQAAEPAQKKTTMILLAQITTQTQTVAQTGIGLGSAIAVVCSWQRNRSILWAILAGIFSWFYVLYFASTRTADEQK